MAPTIRRCSQDVTAFSVKCMIVTTDSLCSWLWLFGPGIDGLVFPEERQLSGSADIGMVGKCLPELDWSSWGVFTGCPDMFDAVSAIVEGLP